MSKMVSWKNGLMEMILLQNQEPAFYTWHLSTKSKPIGVGKKGVSGELFSTESRSFPLTIPHLYRIKIWRYDIDEHVFTTKSRTCILHLTSLYKIKTHRCWEKGGFRGTILYRIKVLPSHHPSPLQNQDLKVWHWWACFYYKIKNLHSASDISLQNQNP